MRICEAGGEGGGCLDLGLDYERFVCVVCLVCILVDDFIE